MVTIIYSPFPGLRSASKVARLLVKHRLAACVNIIQSYSVYEWKGKLEKSREHVLLVKTAKRRRTTAIRMIEENHPYDLPAILWWNVDSTKQFNEWVRNNTKVR